MKKLFLIIMLVVLFLSLILTSCSEVSRVTDPCKREFDDCNYGCGDGVFSSVCKEMCTYDYNKCKNEND